MRQSSIRCKNWLLSLSIAASLAVGAIPASLHAEDAAAPDAVVQKLAHGEINWSNKTITATGSGAPTNKDEPIAVKRLAAERAAKLDALRNILETLQGIQVSGNRNANDAMSNGEIKTKLQGIARNFKVVDTRYYADTSVDVVVQMPIDDQIAGLLIEKPKNPRKLPTAGAESYTGLVINAKNLGVQPAIAPRVVDESGREVYGLEVIGDKAMQQGGLAAYVKDEEQAKASGRAGAKYVVVKALRLSDQKTDVVISNADADKLRDPNTNLAFLADGKVIFIVD